MTLEQYSNKDMSNKYCKIRNLRNESDVEQSLIRPLLEDLDYTEDYVETKATIKEDNIGKKKRKRPYRPDFICYLDKAHTKPVLVVDAKNPSEDAEDGVADAQLYSAVIRKNLSKPKPEQYGIGSNGYRTIIMPYDSNEILADLKFEDFADGNARFERLKQQMGRTFLSAEDAKKLVREEFEFVKPPVRDLVAIFEVCHNLIWRREKIPPAEAFYEFAKLMFIKLRTDREIHAKLKTGSVTPNDFKFSVRWIESLESADLDPVNSVLFKRIRGDLEDEIRAGTKKRMFNRGESIKLGEGTTKEVVRLLEHLDLHGVDEDLNGMMFETFLSAVIRGRALGQFFTPRTVVRFMVDMAGLRVTNGRIPKVLDACCGTGGFLIEAMARLADDITHRPDWTPSEQEKFLQTLKMESLWGIEANKTVARIARINMYLHQDGGSRIYQADSLDRDLVPDRNLLGEVRRDFDELREALVNRKVRFNVVLTNPPFAMRYEAKKKDERRVLQQYDLAKEPSTKKLAASLRSSVMFLERYHDLLETGGLFLTLIDDSVLNTTSNKHVRDWIRQHFVIRAVISLPKNCFVNAGSAAKTSVLVLEKKKQASAEQPAVFMSQSQSVGHTDSGKPEPDSNDLPAILAEWNRFRTTGTTPTRELCFVVQAELLEDRLDVQWYSPEYKELYKRLESAPHVQIRDLRPELKYGASIDADYLSDIPFLRIENLRRNDIDLSDLQFIPSAVYAKQAKPLFLQEGDILIARSGTYVGLCAVVADGMERYTYGSYIIRLRLKDRSRFIPKFLGIYLNSRFGQMQFDRLKTGSLQFNINMEQIKDVVVPLIPEPDQERIVKAFEEKHSAIKRTKQSAQMMETELPSELVDEIASSAGIGGKLQLRDFLGK